MITLEFKNEKQLPRTLFLIECIAELAEDPEVRPLLRWMAGLAHKDKQVRLDTLLQLGQYFNIDLASVQ
jgi:hypothetical protein